MFNNKGLKKVTQRDRYGNQMTYEFEAPVKPLDPTALMKAQMEQANMPPSFMEVPPIMEIEIDDDYADHPGEPRGTDTVPAWLTPGEFVMNAEAVDMYGPEIEAMNEDGRKIQRAQGGTVPRYADGGPVYLRGGSGRNVRRPTQEEEIVAALEAQNNAEPPQSWVTDQLLDNLRMVESSGNDKAVSPAGAQGPYQWMPHAAAEPGYGVKGGFDPFDPEQSREATRQYLEGIQRQYPDWSQEDVLRAYNWGPGNVKKYKAGKRTDIPKEALDYPGKVINWKADGGPVYLAAGDRRGRMKGSNAVAGDTDWFGQSQAKQAFGDEVIPAVVPEVPVKTPEELLPAMGNPPTPPPQPVSAPEVETPEVDVTKENQYQAIKQAVANQQLTPDAARSALLNMGGNFVGRFDSESGSLMTPENPEGITPSVPAAIEQKVAETEEKWKRATKDPSLEETVEVTPPEVATVETNPALNQEQSFKMTPEEQEAAIAVTQKQIQDTIDAEAAEGIPPTAPTPDKEKDVVAAGEQVMGDEGFANTLMSSLGTALSNMFTSDRVAEMLIHYAGSRALGYSHGGSMKYAMGVGVKSFEAEKASAAATAAKKEERFYEVSKADKFTPESIRAAVESNDWSQLRSKDGSKLKVDATKAETFYGANGPQKVYPATDASGNKYFIDAKTGEPVDTAGMHQDAWKVRGTKEWNQRVKDNTNFTRDQINSLRKQFGVSGQTDEGKNIYKTDINAETNAAEIAEWAAKNDVAQEELGGLVASAYHDALNDKRQDGAKTRSLTPYLNQLVIRKQVGNPELFQRKDWDGESPNQYLPAEKLAVINQAIKNQLPEGANIKTVSDQYNNALLKKWMELSDEDRKKYDRKANGNENGFYVYMKEDLGF